VKERTLVLKAGAGSELSMPLNMPSRVFWAPCETRDPAHTPCRRGRQGPLIAPSLQASVLPLRAETSPMCPLVGRPSPDQRLWRGGS
jgi:hypothetical protein